MPLRTYVYESSKLKKWIAAIHLIPVGADVTSVGKPIWEKACDSKGEAEKDAQNELAKRTKAL